MSDSTHREGGEPFAGVDPTHVEADRSGSDSGATHRETDPSGAATRFGSSPIPRPLVEEFTLVELVASGGGATLFSVETSSGEPRILKLYNPGTCPRPEALMIVKSVDDSHVVKIFDFGQCTDDRWYEVQEHVRGGNLADFRSELGTDPDEYRLKEILAQISEAIAAIHAEGLAHHDIKPENILVRSDDPLELVLSDFDLTVVAGSGTYYATNRHATINYQAPETMEKLGGESRDYWALDLTMAMLATGDTPYAGLNEHAILKQHRDKTPPPIVESLPEGRLKQLCRGLTRYDTKKRWSIVEIRGWLEGHNPTVAEESHRPSGVGLGEGEFSDPSELAAALVEHPTLAAATIGIAERRSQFMNELILKFGTEKLARLDESWTTEPPQRDKVHSGVIELLLALDAGQQCRFHGRDITPNILGVTALGESELDRQFVKELYDYDILAAWGKGSSDEHVELGRINKQWRESLGRAEELISQVRQADSRVTTPPLDDWSRMLLAGIAAPELIRDFQQQGETAVAQGPFVPSWYQAFGRTTGSADIADSVAAFMLAGEAERIRQLDATEHREQRWHRQRLLARWISIPALIAAIVLRWWPFKEWPSWFELSTGTQWSLGFCMGFAYACRLFRVLYGQVWFIWLLPILWFGGLGVLNRDGLLVFGSGLTDVGAVYWQCLIIVAVLAQRSAVSWPGRVMWGIAAAGAVGYVLRGWGFYSWYYWGGYSRWLYMLVGMMALWESWLGFKVRNNSESLASWEQPWEDDVR